MIQPAPRRTKKFYALGAAMFFLVFGYSVSAQNFSEYNWMFGNSRAYMSFNKSDARAQLDTAMVFPFGTGGSAVISDPVTGNLLFYTDGVNVYDSNHDLVPSNGVGLSGDPALNNAAVVYPMPYNEGLYYVFTNSGATGANEIQYSIIDKNIPGNAVGAQPPLGDLTLLNQATGLTDPADAMLMIKQDVDNYWLISQNRLTFELNVLPISSGVLGTVQVFDLWTATEPAFVASSFAYDSTNNKLAVAPKESSRNVTLFDFDVATGLLTLDRVILNTGNTDFATEAVYGVAWSQSGNQLYISRHGGAGNLGDLYQYDFNDTLNTVNSVLSEPVFRSYGIKRGPNQSIYHLYQQTSSDPIEIGVITEADSTFHADSTFFNVGYDSLAFEPSGINATQFPSFAAPHFENFDLVDFFVLDTCAEQTSKFFSSVEPTPESYQWDFGDGGVSAAVSPVYTYPAAGTYVVSLTVTLNDVQETVTKSVIISQNELSIDLGMDTVRCVGEVFTLDAGTGGISYAWNTGEATQTIDVDTTGTFSVAVMSPAGCMNYDYIQIVTYEDDTEFRNQWYFGENAGIDFNEPVSAIEDDNLMTSPQAASSVSDLNGELRFYTNGVSVWNRDHDVMINGDNIGGDSTSMQGVMITPLPGDTSIYYIFTSDPVWGDNTYDMKYSVVDMRRDSARGMVVAKDMSFMSNSSERMTALGLGGGFSWLITHEYGNNQFRSYPITATGIGEPLTSAAGSVMRFDEEKTGTAEMQVAQAGGVIAVAFQDTNENFVELFDVNDTTGFITLLAKVDINEPTPALVYGLEFSAALNKLYVTTNSNGSKLLQYDLDSLYAPTAANDITASKFEVGANPSLTYGALATGSDGVIYMAVDNQTMVGTINNSSGDDSDVSFIENGFDLISRTSRLGLPNFVQALPLPSQTPGIQYTNACLGQPTELDGSGTSIIDNYFWTFGDGTFAVGEDTSKLYNEVGIYDVSLRITNRCGLDTTFLEAVSVAAIPVAPTLIDAVTLCNGPVTLAAWPVDTAAFVYTWSTGETTREISVNTASIVSVFITDTTGCQSEPRSSFVDDTSPVVNLGPDQFICLNAPFTDLDARNPGSAFTWDFNGVANGNSLSVQAVDTSLPGTFVYEVEVTDIFDCVTVDDINITVQDAPNFTTTPIATSGCGLADGQIDINVTDIGSFNYFLTGPVTVANTPIAGPGNAVANSLLAGAYTVNVSDVLSGCVGSQTVAVPDGGAGFNIDSVTPTPGCPGNGILDVLMSGGAVPIAVDYELYDQVGNLVLDGSANVVSNGFSITALDAGQYSITVQDAGLAGCIQTFDNINLAGLPLADYNTEPQFYCDADGRIGISPIAPNATYAWTGPNIVGSSVGDSITVSTPGVYTVVSAGTGLCPITTLIDVNQNDSPNLDILIGGSECDGQVVLTADVAGGTVGNTNYLWENGLGTAQRTVTNTGTYSVTVLDQGTGCVSFATRDVEVFDELTVFVTADPNCDNSNEVNISAFANITVDVSFAWTSPAGTPLDINSAEIAVEESGTYSVLVSSDVNICEASGLINVMVQPIDESELLLGPNESFCSDDPNPANSSVALDPGSFSSYEWSIVNTGEILSTDRIFSANEQGVYEVRVTNGFTCVSDFVEVRDDCLPLVHVPTGFTPNSDGLNDAFFVYENPYVSNFEIKIFSRWGELIYQSNDVNFRWNGVYKGQILQVGTYVYLMTYESSLRPESGTVVQRGGVQLIR